MEDVISFGQSIKSNVLESINLCKVFDLIRCDDKLKKKVELIRSCKDKDGKSRLKGELPYFNLGTFQDNIRNNENFLQTSKIIFDVDHVENVELLQEKLMYDSDVYAFFVSPSGNGLKAMYKLSEEITSTKQYYMVYNFYLNELSKRYETKIDLSTKDPARACFLSYDENIYINENSNVLSVDIINYSIAEEKEDFTLDIQVNESSLKEVCEYLSGKLESYKEFITAGFALASLNEKGKDYFIIAAKNNNYQEDTPDKLTKDFNRFLKYYGKTSKPITLRSLFFIAQSKGYKLPYKNFSNSDLGNAERFIHYFGDNLKYCKTNGCWYIWNNRVWELDKTGIIHDYVKKTVQKMYEQAANLDDDDSRGKLRKHIAYTERKSSQDNLLSLAENDSKVRIDIQSFDNKPYLFNCLNGIIDLSNSNYRFEQNDKHNYLTQISNVNYDSTARCPNWLEFINTIFNQDSELIEFIQRSLGYSLTGFTTEDCLFFMYGGGANGKSTFCEIIKMLFGDYYKKANYDLITVKNDSVRNDIARLKGSRIVTLSEIESGKRLHESLVKDLTGGDTIVSRFLYKELFEYKPMFKLWLYGNHKPTIIGTDEGIKRRIKLIPFEVMIPEGKRKSREEILNVMNSELSGILNWILEGFRKWKESGLIVSKKVQNATNQYFNEMDTVQNFLDEYCLLEEGKNISVKNLYSSFLEYLQFNGEDFTVSQKEFNNRVKEKNFVTQRKRDGYYWKNLTIKQEYEPISVN